MFQRFAVVLALVLAFDPGASATQTPQAPPKPPTDEEIVQHAERLFRGHEDTGFFSGAVLVARGDRVLFQKATGLANAELGVANTLDTRFRIVGLSQLFTVAAILRLQEQGKLSVQDPVGKHMAGWPEAYRPMTIHQLLIGESGVKDVTQMPEFVRTVALSRDTQELAGVILKEPLAAPIGTRGRPNNSAFHLLAAVVERVGGLSFTEYVRREIIERAGLKQTSHDHPADVIERRASGYTVTAAGVRNAAWFHMSNAVGMANLVSTVGDVHRFIRALLSGTVVSKASLDLIGTGHVPSPQLPGGAQGPAIGYGISILKGSSPTWNSGSTINGFQSGLWYLPEQQLLIVVLSNVLGNGAPNNMMSALIALATGRKYHVPGKHTSVTPRPEDLPLLAGVWEVQNAFAIVNGQRQPSTLTIRVDGTRIFVRGTSGPEFEWYAAGPGRFFAKHTDSQIVLKDASDEAEYVVAGRASVMRRRPR